LLGEVETPVLLEGRRLHEQDARKTLRESGPTRKAEVVTLEDAMLLSNANVHLALEKRKLIANFERRKLFIGLLPDQAIIGCRDFVDCKNGKWSITVESKNTQGLPSYAWRDH
jgi:hypothetical protein